MFSTLSRLQLEVKLLPLNSIALEWNLGQARTCCVTSHMAYLISWLDAFPTASMSEWATLGKTKLVSTTLAKQSQFHTVVDGIADWLDTFFGPNMIQLTIVAYVKSKT